MKFYIMPTCQFGENQKVWFKYENINYSNFEEVQDEGEFSEEEKGNVEHLFRFQYDFRW